MSFGLIQWSPGITLDMLEEQAIQLAFKFYQRNKTVTASALGISIRTLDAKLEKYADAANERAKLEEERKRKDREFYERQKGIYNPSGLIPNQSGGTVSHSETWPSTASGIHLESSTDASEKHAVPVPEREEVQKMLPRKAASSGAGRAR